MKYLKIFLTVSIFSLLSCGKPTDQGGQTNTYTYENKTGHNIKLTYYYESKKNDKNIANNDSYKETVKIMMPLYVDKNCISFSDSVRIFFPDNKRLFYNSHSTDAGAIYTRLVQLTPENKFNYKITLTPEDYKLAK